MCGRGNISLPEEAIKYSASSINPLRAGREGEEECLEWKGTDY